MAKQERGIAGRMVAATARAGTRAAIAGAVGTAAMDAVWYRRYRAGGGDQAFPAWEFSSGFDGFDDAPAPAKVGRFVARSLHVELPDRSAGPVNNVVHWGTGLGWGAATAVIHAVPGVRAVKAGVIGSLAAFATSYAVLPKLEIYKPITEYDTKTLWKDLSAHLVYGAAMGASTGVLGLVIRKRSASGVVG